MILGVLSDTHHDRAKALPHILKQFRERGVELVVHCGDIENEHLDSFGDFPVICALNKEQLEKSSNPHIIPFDYSPRPHWDFTTPNDRIRYYHDEVMYVGHKRSFDFLMGSEHKLIEFMEQVRNECDKIRWFFSGHMHHAVCAQSKMVTFINPGAVEDSFDGYEFAIVNTETHEIIFCRIPATKSIVETFTVGVISDSLYISKEDPGFWAKLAKEFHERDVRHIIHCGNIALDDISIKTFNEDFTVYYNLRPDQKNPKDVPDNWHLIPQNEPVVTINGYKFCVQLDLGADLIEKSEYDLHKLSLVLRKKYPEISFILCGLTCDPFYEEGEHIRIINPGGILRGGHHVEICLPRTEITMRTVPRDPVPPLE